MRAGRFHRYAGGKVEPLPAELRGKFTAADPADVVRSVRHFYEPLVDRKTWVAVQKKLRARRHPDAPKRAPKDNGLYLAGLVVCTGCGKPMFARKDRREFYCATCHTHREKGRADVSPCERNAVSQAVLEGYVNRYLEEAGKRVELLAGSVDAGPLTGRLRAQEADAWRGFGEGIARLTAYLAEHQPDAYNAILREHQVPPEAGGPGPDDFVAACLACYRAHFDPAAAAAELARLEAEHTARTRKWADLPTPRAKEKAKAELTALEERIADAERRRADAAGAVEGYWNQIADLNTAIADARLAMRAEAGARALRRRAEALRGLLCRIECTFVLTGKKAPGKKAGPGGAWSKLAEVTFVPVAGDGATYRPGDGLDRRYGGP
jgi:hypothetical protein